MIFKTIYFSKSQTEEANFSGSGCKTSISYNYKKWFKIISHLKGSIGVKKLINALNICS